MEMAASWPLDVPRGIRRGLSTYGHRVIAPAKGLGALPTRRYFTVTCVTPRVKALLAIPPGLRYSQSRQYCRDSREDSMGQPTPSARPPGQSRGGYAKGDA